MNVQRKDATRTVEKKINKFYSFLRKILLHYAQTRLLRKARGEAHLCEEEGRIFEPYHLSSAYTVTLNQDNILSLYYDITERRGSVPECVTRHGDSWSLMDGLPWLVPLPSRKKGIRLCQSLSGRRSGIYRNYDQRNSYLKPEGSVLYYPPYTLEPCQDEYREFVVVPVTD